MCKGSCMMIKNFVTFLCLFTLSCAAWAADKKYNFVSKNKEGDFLTATYFDPDQKELLIRVFKTKEETLELPTVVKGPLELTPKGKYTVADDREFNVTTDKGKQDANSFINRYNKDQHFLTSVSQATRKDCTALSSTAPLPEAGNAQSLASLSLQIADKLATENDKIVFRVDLSGAQFLMSSQLSPKGDIISLEFADGTTDATRKAQTILGGKFAKKKLEIIGPQNNAAYLKLDSDPVLKVTTENFTSSGGDFIVTTVDPTPSRAEFVENLYKITISGNKLTVSPRQIIASELDFSNELKPTDGVDEKPTALGFQNFLANMVWGGGKDKTEKEIVKAGKEAVKSDPLLKQYLTEQDVERIAKKIIADGYVINKDAISEKPKLMGVAYLYFSEELLKKAIMEQMPMSEAELQPMVDGVMANFRACIKEAKYSGGVEDCKNKFAKTAVVKIARNIMYQQIDQNLGPAVSGPNAKEQIAEAKKKSDVEYARCINKYFTIPYEEAEKAKKPLPDAMKIGVSCVYTSVQYAANLVVNKELENTFKTMGIYKPGDDLVLSSIQKSNSGCYQQMGITVDTIGRRYDMNKLQGQTTDGFKSSLIGCVNSHIKAGGRVAVQRTIENNPDLNSIMKSANVPASQKAEFVQKILSTGYDRCMVELEKYLPKGSVLNPTNCEEYITLKAKEDAFRMILKKELSVVKTKPSPWEKEIDPELSRCTNNFFASYMTRKGPPLTEKDLTVCFRDAISSAGFYIGGELLNQEVVENPAIKPYGLKLSDSEKTKYQNMIKVCMSKELKAINKVEELTAINSKSKKTNLDTIKDKCTVEVAQSLVPELAKDILKIEMRKAIASEKTEDKAKLEAELDKIIDPVIKAELLPRMAKIQNMDDVTKKVLPAFTTEATLKAAGTILDFKLSSFATNPEGKRRMAQVRDTLVNDLRKEISGGKSLSPAIMSKVESKAIVLVTNTMIDQYFGKRYPQVAKTLTSALDPNFVKALTEVKFVTPPGAGGKSDKAMDIEGLANTLGQYIDEALKYDPSIVDAVKDLQKKILADINAQKKAGKTPTLSIDQLIKTYWKHPAFKKIILSQVSKELSTQFASTLKQMEADDMKALTEPSNADLIKTKYSNLRSLVATTTSAKQLEAMFSTPQGEKALASIKDNMLIPLLNGKEATAQNKAAYTLEVAKTLTANRAPGSFAERFTAHNLQAELTADKRSRGAVVKTLMGALGYKIENYEWDNLRKTPSGQKALNYFNDQILLPSMTGQKFDLNAKKEVLKDMIKEGLKGK